MDTQFVVIGGGPGGYAAAFLAADLGMEVTLVDLQPRLGGVCLLCGCIPSKALLHVAKVMGDAKHLAAWGIAFPSPSIDINALRTQKDKVIATLSGGLKQLASKRGVRVACARATLVDSQTLRLTAVEGGGQLNDDHIRFQHCILATGSRPSRIAAFDLPTPRVMDSTAALRCPTCPNRCWWWAAAISAWKWAPSTPHWAAAYRSSS